MSNRESIQPQLSQTWNSLHLLSGTGQLLNIKNSFICLGNLLFTIKSNYVKVINAKIHTYY